MTDDEICLFKDSDIKNIKGVITSDNISLVEINELNPHHYTAQLNTYIKKLCNNRTVYALLANIEDENMDESWICFQVGRGSNISSEIISDLMNMQTNDKSNDIKRFKTLFHQNTPKINYSASINHQKYKTISLIYQNFKIVVFDNDIFLNSLNINANPKDKSSQFVETIFAHMTRAYFWNISPAEDSIEGDISKSILNKEILIQEMGTRVKIHEGKITQ